MNIAVRYQSRGGNTKAVAQVMADMLNVESKSIDVPVEHPVDMLFVGGGVYMWKMDETLKEFMENLDPDKVGQIVCFSTTGTMDATVKQIREAAIKKNIQVNDHELLLRMLVKGHSALGLKGGNLSEKQMDKIRYFVRDVVPIQ